MYHGDISTSVNSNTEAKVQRAIYNGASRLYILERTATHLLRKHDSTASSTGGELGIVDSTKRRSRVDKRKMRTCVPDMYQRLDASNLIYSAAALSRESECTAEESGR